MTARRLILSGSLLVVALATAASCGAPEVKYAEETGGTETTTGARPNGGDDESGGSATGATGGTGGGGGVIVTGGEAGRAGAGGPGETGGEGGGTEDGGAGGTGGRTGGAGGTGGRTGGAGGTGGGGTGGGGGAVPDTCENGVLDGDETDLDCGGSCQPCDNGRVCGVNGDCVSGACIGLICSEPGCDNGLIDPNEGGTDCGGVCPTLCPTGEPCDVDGDCESGVCTSRVCVEATCTDLIENGDETDIDCGGPDPSCARCEVGDDCLEDDDCALQSCVDLTCALVCPDNFDDCDGDVSSGCEANLLTSLQHCGACGRRCSLPHAVSACSAGECVIAIDTEGQPRCNLPYAACDADTANGCEANLLTDPENCGGCGIRCTDANGTPTCVDGECGSVCGAGFADCGGDYRCETDTTTSVDNCSGCGDVCPADQGSPWCRDSECGFTPCDPGTGDCDGDGTCETNVNISDDHCGACGNACLPQDGTGNCAAGTCEIAACDAGFDDCNGDYADGCEQSLATLEHCAACDTPCARANAAVTCETGSCAFVGCNANYGNCDENTGNGCETDLRVTVADCGGCGQPCAFAHAAASCVNSGCVMGACSSGYDDCNDSGVDGCETGVTADPNCGGCGIDCVTNTGTSSNPCNGTACVPVCVSGYGNCDSNAANGCETSLTNNLNHCGACGVRCSGSTPYCVNTSGSTWACRGYLDIAVVNYKSEIGMATTTVSHAMATAESDSANQMILVGVASYGNSLAGAKPSSVKYNNVAMTKVGTVDYFQNNSFAGIYYLLDADLPGAGTYNVIATKSDNHGTVMDVIELTGVSQLEPTANGGSTYGNCGSADPISSITVGAVGSWTYDIAAAFGGNTGGTALAGPQGAPTATRTVNVIGDNQMLGVGGYRGPYSATGSYTGVGWSLTSCNGGAHVIVAIERGTSG